MTVESTGGEGGSTESTDGEATTGELAEYIAALENDKPQSELTSQERKRVYVGIYQTHLPKMDDADVVDVDDRGTVTLGSNAEEVFRFLDSSEASYEWPKYYGIATGLGGLLLLVTWLFSEVLMGVAFGLTLVVYAALVGAHARAIDEE